MKNRLSVISASMCAWLLIASLIAPLTAGQDATSGGVGPMIRSSATGKINGMWIGPDGAFDFGLTESGNLTLSHNITYTKEMMRMILLAAEKDWFVKADLDKNGEVVAVEISKSGAFRERVTMKASVRIEPAKISPPPPLHEERLEPVKLAPLPSQKAG